MRWVTHALLAATVFVLQTAALANRAPEAPVGFIWHFPFVDVGTDLVGASGATAMIARAPWGEVQPTESAFELGCIDRQIAEAERGGFGIVLLLECSPFCAPRWLRNKLRDAGESGRSAAGAPDDLPSASSVGFERAREAFLSRTIAYVRKRDRRRVVTHYQAGVEWWFPYDARHADADVRAFQRWLRSRHGSVNRLNALWGARFRTFADVVAPPIGVAGRLWEKGSGGLAPILVHDARKAPMLGIDSAAHDWAEFWQGVAASDVERVARRIRSLDPSRPTMSYLTFAFAPGAEWDYVDWSAMRVDRIVRSSRFLDVLGLQLPVARGDAYRVTVGLDIARKSNKPLVVLDLLDFTDGVRAGYTGMARATHAAVQHGASGMFYCCWNGAKDFNFHPDWPIGDISRLMREARTATKIVRGMRVIPDGAILLPIIPGTPGNKIDRDRTSTSFIGLYKLLQDLGRTVDVVTPDDLAAGHLPSYRWLLAPDCPTLPRSAAARLTSYARSGRLIVAGRVPQTDEYGRKLTALANMRPSNVLPDLGAAYAGTLSRDAAAGDTPPLVLWRTQTEEHDRTLATAWRLLGDRLQPRGFGIVAPDRGVSTALLTGPGRRAWYFVNTSPRAADGVALTVRGAKSDLSVWCDLVRVPVRAVTAGRDLRITLPPFRTSCIAILTERRTRPCTL